MRHSLSVARLPAVVLLAATLLRTALGVAAVEAPFPEGDASTDRSKAAFLYRFGGYTKWPEAAPSTEFVIGVIGDARVASELQALLPGRTIDGTSVVLQEVQDVAQFSTGQILFVGAAAAARLPGIARALRGRHVLLVSDQEQGLRHGAVINFQLEKGRTRFEVSMPAARGAGLELSSRLLGVALRVDR